MQQMKTIEPCKRSGRRREVEWGALAFRRDGSRSVVTLSDISYEGCQFAGAMELQPSERFRLVLPCLGETNAQVRWTNDGRVGAAFEDGGADALDLAGNQALHLTRTLNFGSGNAFGRKGAPALDKA